MVELKTTYLGLELKNPLIAASSPLSEELDNLRKLEDAGAAAVVMHSVFEEQIAEEAMALHAHMDTPSESFAEALSYFPEPDDFHVGPEIYLDHLKKAKEALSIPVLASLNGITPGGWAEYAKEMEAAGADAIECNVYYLPTSPDESVETVENRYVEVLSAVKAAVSIPVSMKLSPYFSNMAAMAHRLDGAGADGLVLFNRFYQPDIDLDTLEVKPNLVLSNPFESRLALRWIAILHGRLQAGLAAAGGLHSGEDVLKVLLAGADTAQVCSILLKEGIDHLGTLLTDMAVWLEKHEYDSIEQMKGSLSQQKCADPSAFERANYMKALISYPRS